MIKVRGTGNSHEILDRKLRKFFDTVVVYMITSIFMPLLDESLKTFIKSPDILKGY